MKLEYISQRGSILNLTQNPRFKISNIDGLTLSSIDLATSTVASMDGDIVNNKRTIPRSIIIDIAIENNVEETKRYILQFIKPKDKAKLVWEQQNRKIQIEGVVENIEMPRFTMGAIMQVSIYCSQPYWEDVENRIVELSGVDDLHYFTNYENDMLLFPSVGIPFGEYNVTRSGIVKNEGDVEVGLEIRIIALRSVSNPRIYKLNGEFIGANVNLEVGDEIVISTIKGNKTITLNGENILSKIMPQSTWLDLKTGEETFVIDSDSGEEDMYFNVIYKQRYV